MTQNETRKSKLSGRPRGEIQQLRPVLEGVRTAGFWLGESLIENAPRLAGENPKT